MRIQLAAAMIAIVAGSGCGHTPPPGPHGPGKDRSGVYASGNVSANSVFGAVKVTAMSNECAGRVQLTQGLATLKDSCFSGDTNVVICTDSTAANPVKCAAGEGQLEITGTGTDVINYARVR